jgi:hypothetical protein
MHFDSDEERYITNIDKLSAHCNDARQFTLEDLGFSKAYPRLY